MSEGLEGIENSEDYHFSSLFQAHHEEYTVDLPFWLDLARTQGDPILELGCGTGRVLFQLAEIGYKCFGIDNSPGMLATLEEKSLSINLACPVNTILADMTCFSFQVIFPLIILPCNTFSTLGQSERIATLNCVHQHLSVDGVFSICIPNPATLNSLITEDQPDIEMFFPHPETKNPVQASYRIEKGTDKVIIHWYYDHLYPNGKVERQSIDVGHYLTPVEQYISEFKTAKFEVKAIYGDFDYSPISECSPNLIIVAYKI
jgi:SAM-dependent methyltransferase